MTNEAEQDQGLPGRHSAQADSASPAAAGAPDRDCGDLGLAILRDGTWTYRGSPIRRIELVRLFASVLRRETDGVYWMVTPVERGRIPVEDVPFTIVEVRHEGEGRERRIDMRSNLEEWVELGPEHGLRLAQGAGDLAIPYVLVRPGREGRLGLEGRLERAPFYHLVELAEPGLDGTTLGLWSRGVFFALEEPQGEEGAS